MTEAEVREGASGQEPHLRDYVRILYSRRWVLASVTAFCVLATLVFVIAQTPIFCPTCLLLLQPTQARVTDIKQVYDPTFGAEAGGQLRREFLETHYQLILSRPNVEKTFRQMGYDRMPEFQDKKDPLRSFTKLFAVKPVRNSYLAEVSFQWKDPKLATETLSFLIQEYMRSCRERALGVTTGGLDALLVKAQDLRPKVEAKAQELQRFMADHNMVSLEDSQNIVAERLKEISRNLITAETRRIQAESRYNNIKDALDKRQTSGDMPEVIDSQTVRDLKLEYIKRNLDLTDLSDSFGPNHPAVKAARATVATVTEKLDMEVRSVLSTAQAEMERARQQEAELRASLAQQEKAVMAFNELKREYGRLQDMHSTLSRAYNAVTQRIEEIEIAMAAGSREDGVFLVSPAKEPTEPIRPKKARSLAISLAVGLVLGLGLCFFLDYLDTSIKTKDEAEALLGAPVLGFVPSLRDTDTRGADGVPVNADLLAVEKPRSPMAESFRSVRTALSFIRTGGGCQQFAVTSALPSEGKTLVSANIGIALAQSGRRVLLVDADMRRPRLHKVFHMTHAVGLSNLLAKQDGITIESAVQASPVPGLSILPSGPIPPNPAELLGGPSMVELSRALAEQFDYVIYDTPPAVSVTDSAVLARNLQGLLLVVRTYATDRAVVAHARELLATAGARLMGVVLNGIDTPHGGYGYYGYYYYYSRYYGDPESKDGKREGRPAEQAS